MYWLGCRIVEGGIALMPSLELKIKRIVKADNILLTQPSKSSPNLMYGFRSWLYAVIIIRRSIS
jgi:hypothetical protein